MSDGPTSIAFFDPERGLHGSARSGATLLFSGSSAEAVPEGPAIEGDGELLRARLDGRFDLELAAVGEEIELGGATVRVCRVSGDVGGTRIEGLGTASRTRRAPEWEQLDALRSISILAGEGHALLALAQRPRGAPGHGDERITARLLADGELLDVEEARISTVYDGDGRQRSAGLELWLPGEDFPRRAAGSVLAGTSLELEGLQVHAAVFGWRLEGREAIGSYELMVRSPTPAAA